MFKKRLYFKIINFDTRIYQQLNPYEDIIKKNFIMKNEKSYYYAKMWFSWMYRPFDYSL